VAAAARSVTALQSNPPRARRALGKRPGTTEKRKSGGIGLLRDGLMCVGKAQHGDLVARQLARVVDFTGKAMADDVFANEPGVGRDELAR
jgi:hypothetical protein